MIGLDQVADVYTPDLITGAYTVLAQTALPCRLAHLGPAGAAADRSALALQRNMIWGPGYEMPAYAQVLVDSKRWNVLEGTQSAYRGVTSAVVYRTALVVQAA